MSRPVPGPQLQAVEDVVEDDVAPLEDLNFTDLYIRIDNRSPSRYRIGPNERGVSGNFEVKEEFEPQIETLRTIIGKADRDDGTITHDTMRLRFSRARIVDGQVWAAIRRIPLEIPRLDHLLLSAKALPIVRAWGRTRGIVMVGGATGAGKTTTAVAALHEYLVTNGGIAVAIEDPSEYLLQGSHGKKGYCFQMEVGGEHGWGESVKTALRWRPRYIFLGEVRTPEAARQALRASTSGHLVLTTVHGGSVEETVGTVMRLAEADMGDVARSLLADNLVGVVHQRLNRYGPDVDILETERGTKIDDVRKAIKGGQLSSLAQRATQFLADRPA